MKLALEFVYEIDLVFFSWRQTFLEIMEFALSLFIYCSQIIAVTVRLGGVKLGVWLTGKLGRAWVGAWVGAW